MAAFFVSGRPPFAALARRSRSCHESRRVTIPKAIIHSRITLLGLLLGVLPWSAQSQIPGLKAAAGKAAQEAAPEAPETPEQARTRLKGWAADWKAQADALANPTALPAGITEKEVTARRSDALLGIFSVENSLRSLDTKTSLEETLAQSKALAASWEGFKEPGPYSFVLHDELRRQQEAVTTRLAAYESAVTMLDREISTRQDEIKKSEEALRRAADDVDRAAPAELDAAAWRLDAARLRVKVLGASAAMFQLSRETTRIRIVATTHEADLLKRKITALGTVIAFPEADLEQLKKSTTERAKQITKELSKLERAQHLALGARQKLASEVETLKAVEPATEESAARLADAEGRLRFAETETQSLADRFEILGGRQRFLNEYVNAQKARMTLLTSTSASDRAEAYDDLASELSRTTAFNSLVDVRRNAALSEMQEHEAKLALMAEGSPLRTAGEKALEAQRDELDSIERFGQEVSSVRLDIARWLGDSREQAKSMTWGERFRSYRSRIAGWAKGIWNFEVYPYEDKTEVEGEIITVKRSLVLGWLLSALLFFYLTYRAGSWLLKRGFRRLVAKGRMEEGQSQTLRRWTRIAMSIVLALITLHLLKIPLTAFAFLGGALAIGVGFGTQTLFKNFISGILVLFERKVRVGDILDVDGVAGTVTSIDTRSSMIRTFDGVEIILPNSLLLENKVTNWTHDTAVVRRVVRVGVSYGSPLREVSNLLSECAAEHGVVSKSPEPQVILEDFGPDSLVFALYYWIDLRGKTGAMVVGSDLRFMIEKRLTEAGISIAFPQREIHLSADKPLRVEVAQSPDT
jgi:potassium-dependent mechanosensitive channel